MSEPLDKDVAIVIEMIREQGAITACAESFGFGLHFGIKLSGKGVRMSEIELCQLIDQYDERLRDRSEETSGR